MWRFGCGFSSKSGQRKSWKRRKRKVWKKSNVCLNEVVVWVYMCVHVCVYVCVVFECVYAYVLARAQTSMAFLQLSLVMSVGRLNKWWKEKDKTANRTVRDSWRLFVGRWWMFAESSSYLLFVRQLYEHQVEANGSHLVWNLCLFNKNCASFLHKIPSFYLSNLDIFYSNSYLLSSFRNKCSKANTMQTIGMFTTALSVGFRRHSCGEALMVQMLDQKLPGCYSLIFYAFQWIDWSYAGEPHLVEQINSITYSS